MDIDPDTQPARRRGVAPLPLIVAGALFMETLDGTVLVTALPQIATSFSVTPESLGLTVTAYLVAVAAFVPASGWAAERFGARNVFAAAVGLFTLASVLCGLSTNVPMFVAARVLQGVAAALMSPVGRLAVIRTTEKKDLIGAIAAITWPGLIAPVIGPPLGGLIATYASWRWIFFLNVPIGIAGVLLAFRFMPNGRADKPAAFDLPGFALTAVALGGLIYGLDRVGQAGPDRLFAGTMIVVSVVLGWAAVAHARRASAPLLDFRALRWPTYRLTSASWSIPSRVAIGATPFILPLMFQIGFGYTAFQSGLMLLVYMVGNLTMKTATTAVLRRFAFRPVLVGANAISAAALFMCAWVTPSTPSLLVWAALYVAGASRSMTFTALNTLTYADVAPEERAGATALNAMLQQLAASLGVAAAALCLNLTLAVWRAPMLRLFDFHIALLVAAVTAAVAALGFLALPRDAGEEVRGGVR